MEKYFLSFLALLARSIIRIHKPYVIGVTGTVGKTTMTSHIAILLGASYSPKEVMISPYHYNGEYGLPLSIIGAKTGGKNPFLWIWVFLQAFIRMIRCYPRYLVLEYGIDHPGEMEFLLSIVVPDIAVITRVAPNHLEQFGTFERYREAKLLLGSDPKTHLIVHESLSPLISRDHVSYGEDENSDIVVWESLQHIDGISASVAYREITYDVRLVAFGSYQLENILPLFSITEVLDIPKDTIIESLPLMKSESGRSNILEGITGATIIDGSYNGGYESIIEGLKSLTPFLSTHRIILFLGDMRELGDHAVTLHGEIANYIREHFSGSSYRVSIFLVGPLSREYIYPVIHDLPRVSTFLSSREAGKEISREIMSEITPTLIYVKGSQNTIFLEEGIKEFMARRDESTYLVRQSKDWMKKKEAFFASLEKK